MSYFHLVSLGCAKNLVDSEVILGTMYGAGWHLEEDPEKAEVIIINTCGFIQEAVEEAIEEILAFVSLKESKADPSQLIVVTGCLVQRYKEKLVEELPEVDLFVGTEGPEHIARFIDEMKSGGVDSHIILPPRYVMSSDSPRILSTPFYRSWLKITEGCNNRCSYCMIPAIRGNLRSRHITDVVEEATRLELSGVKEISLVAQDSTAYGNDLGDASLEALLRSLLDSTQIPWIRLLYLYPTGISDELIDLVKSESRILPYMDIPMQHVNDDVLAAMNRRYTKKDLAALIERIRTNIPDIALRTTFLVGFPGETDEQYAEIENFIRQTSIDHVGVFNYSNEEGAPSEKFAGQVPEDIAKERRDALLHLQSELSAENLKKYMGKKLEVLVDGVSGETDLLLEGRSKYQAPDVDGIVYINEGTASPGDLVEVEITETTIYDLVGGIVGP